MLSDPPGRHFTDSDLAQYGLSLSQIQTGHTVYLPEERVIREVMLKNTIDGEFTTTGDVSEVAVFPRRLPTNALTGQSLNITHGWHMD